jgi:hypothetical protein
MEVLVNQHMEAGILRNLLFTEFNPPVIENA